MKGLGHVMLAAIHQAGVFGKSSGAATQKNRCVRLRQEDGGDDGENASKGGDDRADPLPFGGLRKEATALRLSVLSLVCPCRTLTTGPMVGPRKGMIE
jgi:hypothetical protein